MIRAVFGHGGGEAAFLAAANAQPLPGIELASAWYALGKGQERGANGWYFFTAGKDEPPFALALRRGTALACGTHDPEELGEFLRAVGVLRLTARALGEGAACPDGFAAAERMLGLVRPCDRTEPCGAATGPGLPAGYRLTEARGAARIAHFLRQEGAFAAPERSGTAGEGGPTGPPNGPGNGSENETGAERRVQQAAARLFARELEARAAVGLGCAAFLEREETAAPDGPGFGPGPGTPPAAAMVVTIAPRAKMVCLSALYLRAALRGQGLGSRMVRVLTAEAGHCARGVCLLCRPERAGFYARLGFVPEGEYACFVPAR